MKVLLLGASGFVGARLLSSLVTQGHNVRVLSRKSRSPVDGVEFFQGDLVSKDLDFDKLLTGCDVVYNCAGEIRNESAMHDLHVVTIQQVLNAMARMAIQHQSIFHFVQLSSVGAYGTSKEKRIVTESTPPNPEGTYEITKTEADKLIISNAGNDGFTFSIVRPSNIFASDMPNASLRQLANMVKRRMFFYVGSAGAISTYVHVEDVVDVLMLVGFDDRAKGHIFNVSNDCRLEAMIEGLALAMGVPPPGYRVPELMVRSAAYLTPFFMRSPVTQERIDSLVSRTTYSVAKLEAVLDFVPKRSVPDYIGEIIAK